MFPDKPIFSYIGMALAVVAIVFTVILPEYAAFIWTLAGLLGYGSGATLRKSIDSKGWKTTATFAVIVVLSILQWFGVITPDLYKLLLAAFTPVLGITFQQALAKSPTASVPRLKKAA